MSVGLVIYKRGGEIDAIDQYTRHLVATLTGYGCTITYVADGPDAVPADLPAQDWILVQYNPFRYGRAGFAPTLLADILRLKRRSSAPLAVMVHEAWIDMVSPKSAAVGVWQRMQLRALLRSADAVMASTEPLATALGPRVLHVPVGSNITPIATTPGAARAALGLDDRLVVVLFGRDHPDRALDYAEAAVAAIAQARADIEITVLNVGGSAPPIDVPAGVELRTTGQLRVEEISRYLRAGHLALLPFRDGISTKRTTLMAALAHGLPVLALRGECTDRLLNDVDDAVTLTEFGDRAAYAAKAAALASDPARLAQLGAAASSLYEARFTWSVVASQVRSTLERMPSRRSRGVMFVAHHIGGPGGMERHTEQLLGRVIDSGCPVTVVARTCDLAPRAGLRFKRVRCPGRPFVLLYPSFFVIGSLTAARRREALLHTTGAVVGNRSDLSTVHYCHVAAATRVTGSRASEPGILHHLNQLVGGPMSRTGERWCYRPTVTRLLCAVSGGVGHELVTEFPAMRKRVRVIPNGVDATVFRPDPSLRRTAREALGFADHARLALFAGGDWERKGLPVAIAALADAPEWQLIVAGAGDAHRMAETARTSGSADRLHFLGRVTDMASAYAAADAFVFPTSYEAFPLVALEAAAAGLPLLITRVNGAEDLIEDGVNGWFITTDPAEIARRLRQLGDDPTRASAMGAAAADAARPYSWDAMAERYLSLYRELMR